MDPSKPQTSSKGSQQPQQSDQERSLSPEAVVYDRSADDSSDANPAQAQSFFTSDDQVDIR